MTETTNTKTTGHAAGPNTAPSFLFVCTGNICRSPLAELAMKREAAKRGLQLDIDSAGIGNWHAGDAPDPRAQEVAKKNGLSTAGQHARQVRPEDFSRFSHIIALDRSHVQALQRLKPQGASAEIHLLLDSVAARKGEDVIDPYYGTAAGFETTLRDVTLGCEALATELLDKD